MRGKISSGEPETFFHKNWHLILLSLIAFLSFGLNFYAISKMGYGNAYYAAAIKSMTESFKNFFYASFDPAGLVSVDKPPLALWIQTLFVLVFGYHGWAMLLPQALAGTGSSIMMYVLTAKHFGRPAGLISALVFALTPAAVVAARNNTMDMQLVFVLLVAVWFLFRAIERTKRSDLFLAALFVGLGFNIKMLEAYLILPALATVYLIFSKEKLSTRIISGLISLLIMAAVSFSWVVAVDLTPAGSRPYVDSSTNNTVLELIIGHNGMERIIGQKKSGTGGHVMGTRYGFDGRSTRSQLSRQNANKNGVLPPMQGQNGVNAQSLGIGRNWGPGMGGGTGNSIGTAGILRLWGSSLYGQASWLIVLALFCILAKLRKFHIKNLTLKQGIFVFWIFWLATMYIFFSFARFWHQYYLCMLAPGIAGLVGIGLVDMVRAYRKKRGLKQILLPLSLIVTLAIELVYVWGYATLRTWLFPLMAAAASVSLICMAIHYFKPKRLILLTATGFMLLSLLAAPFYWALTVVIFVPQNATMPYAGPELASTAPVPGMTPDQEVLTTGDSATLALEKYLVQNYKKGSYLIVSRRSDDVAQFIVDTGLPAVAYGGFSGADKAMTLDQLKELVSEGKVTYFMISGQTGNASLVSYVKQNATLINAKEYASTTSQQSGIASDVSLYLFK